MSLRANVSERGNLIKIIWQILCCSIVLMGLLRRWQILCCSIVLMGLLRRFAPHNDVWRYVQPLLTAFTQIISNIGIYQTMHVIASERK